VGLGVALEAVTLRAAFSAAKDLPTAAWLSVNASPQMLLAVVPLVAALEGLELDLVVEVTEHVAVDDYGRLREAIALLGPRVDLSIDDAGSGYASLRHILELAPRFVKLDTSLVGAIDTDPARQAIVAGLVHFATTTGCELIAEGIETESQLETLRCLGIRLGQGYLLGRPQPLPTKHRNVKADPRSGDHRLRRKART
jgi:EAL domain-containing protein (putative c-di-GMP-specific phosphodiesterase class I)